MRFCKIAEKIIDIFLITYPKLYNYIDVRSKKTIRWLKWAGFEFAAAAPYGVEQRPFHLFTKTKLQEVRHEDVYLLQRNPPAD
jgi:hypothetical protein